MMRQTDCLEKQNGLRKVLHGHTSKADGRMERLMSSITDRLFELQDVKYGDFNWKLLPGIERKRIIGVRTPALKKLAKDLAKDPQIGDFLHSLPHTYNEEYALHDFIIAQTKDFSTCIAQVEELLPYIDNWGVCDQLSPQCFKRHREELLPYIDRWLKSTQPYIVRFGIKMLMDHFLDDSFKTEYARQVALIRSEHYYIRMMQAWYFATALAKQWDATLPLINELEDWTRCKAIQKARESYRISDEHKKELSQNH